MMVCKYCQETFEPPTKHKRAFCSKQCQSAFYINKNVDKSYRENLTCGTIGTISELSICNDLLKKGFHVFKSVSPNCPCDLIIMKESKLFRVEVTTFRMLYNGKFYHSKKNEAYKYDILACFHPETNACYYFSSNQQSIDLSL